MFRFLIRRITFIAIIIFLIILAVQLGMRMARNSEVSQPNFDVVSNTKRAWSDTRSYLNNASQGKFGYIQTTYGLIRVGTIVQQSYLNSMGLLLVSLGLAATAGVTLGAMTALLRVKRLIFPILVLTILGISTPSFFGGLLLRQGELLYLRVFGHPLVSMAGFGWDYKHMLLPVLVLSARPLAYLTRAAFLAFDRVMQADYIRTAYAKGLTQSRTVNIHALRNISIPILTAIGVSLRFSLSSLPVVEFLFAWPGMGLRMLEAIDGRQTDLVVTLAIALGLSILGINLLLDMTYRFIDPRIRDEP